jgi:hypothetical protein
MIIVRPSESNWRDNLMTGPQIGPAFEAWIEAEDYKKKLE